MDEIQKAKAILREAGYFTDNLWHVDDVKSRYEGCDDAKAQEILDYVLTNERLVEDISELIWLEIQDMQLEDDEEEQ
jgi:hypothetical protein